MPDPAKNSMLGAERFGELIHSEFFVAPCKCCGSREHGVLMQDNLSNGTTKINLACSVTRDDNWEDVFSNALKSVRILPSIEKIAGLHSHHVDRVNESMPGFRKYGYGKHMDYMQLVDFENDLFKYCIEVRKETLFKRYVPPCEGLGDLEEGTDIMG